MSGSAVAGRVAKPAARAAALPAAMALALLAGVVAAPAATAAEAVRYDYQGAAGVCAPSLPAHAAGLRARPLGLANEGSADSFVTCTFIGTNAPGRTTTQLAVTVANAGIAGAVISCTLVDGFASGSTSDATYNTKSASLFPGGYAFIAWEPDELAGAPSTIARAAVQCRLPARTTLHYLGTYYREDVAG